MEKRSSPRVSVVPFQLLPSLPLKKTRFRAETRTKTSVVVTSSTKSRPTSTYSLCYLNIRGLGMSQKKHSRNLWFPGCWEDLYLKVNHLAFSSHGMHCFSFSKELKFHSYSTIRGIRRNGSLERCTLFRNYSDFVEIKTIGCFRVPNV